MGLVFHDVHITIGPGIAFIGVTNDVFLTVIFFFCGIQFEPERKAGATSAS